MIRPSLLRLAGTLLLAASFFVFAYGIASVFYGHIAVTAILILIFGLMLHFGFCLMDKGDDEEKDGIGTDSHKEDFASAVVLISHYADKYHDKDAEYAKEHIEALDDIIKDEDYHIQRARDLDRERIDTEDMIISIAERIKGRYDDTTKESKSPDKDGAAEDRES